MDQCQSGCCPADGPVGEVLDGLGPQFMARAAGVLSMLSEGRPLAMREVGAALGIPEGEAAGWLRQVGAELDGEGRLVGFGLTSVPTPHSYEVDGRSLYAWCAGDTLIFPLLLGRDAKVESADPVSGAKVSLVSTPEGPRGVRPASAVISWPERASASDIRGSFCFNSLWFASPETAGKYAAAHGGVAFGTAEEFLRVFGPAFEAAQPTGSRSQGHGQGADLCSPAAVVGETGARTLNVVQAAGRRAHVLCGADILLSGLRQDVKGEAVCPVCGAKVEMVVEGGLVASLEPKTALLHYVVDDESRFSICCEGTFVFDRRDCLESWLRSYKGPAGRVDTPALFMAEASRRRRPPEAA